ncbi:hypothetical protein [Kordiimonas sp.]|uniref:hypothetical protein n=1 Tax=Kordiimonas sp. TaxID=1970157 RepID=UPI003A8FDC2E
MLPQFSEATDNDCVAVSEQDDDLSRRCITPHIGTITAGLSKLRVRVDQHFEAEKAKTTRQKPAFLSEMKDVYTYPYGYCDVIRNAVWDNIHKSLNKRSPFTPYFIGLKPFLRKGGLFRKIWGELTYGPYFQSAMQLGAYYIDVSNDTVVITKPKLDIKLLKDASLRNVDDFEHYFDVAQAYFKWDVYPNTQIPEIAFLYPGIAVHQKTGALVLCGVAKPLFYKNLNTGGLLAQQFLTGSKYSDRRLTLEQEARLASFRSGVLPALLVEARARNPQLEEDLGVIRNASAMHAWLASGQSQESYRQVAIRLEAFASRIGAVLRPYSLK